MQKATQHLDAWTSEFGQSYTDRNFASPEQADRLWEAQWGVRKSEVFRQFLSCERLPAGRALEVGCNVGNQLKLLHSVNPGLELYGVEPQNYAMKKARALSPDIHFVPGNMFEIPFRDGYFDVVMTNGVLIHIAPADLARSMGEIVRCARRFIFLCEYFSESPCEVRYRDNAGLMWKMNYGGKYLEHFPSLRVVEQRLFRYPNPAGGDDLVDQVCLLEKTAAA
jgi:pseudaminic acid biosynthesis-associated methylase